MVIMGFLLSVVCLYGLIIIAYRECVKPFTQKKEPIGS